MSVVTGCMYFIHVLYMYMSQLCHDVCVRVYLSPVQMIDEFTDVNRGEKEMMKLWNLFAMDQG